MEAVTGIAELDRKLTQFSTSGANRAMRAGISAGMTQIAKAIRQGVNSSDASSEMKRAARKAVGRRLVTKETTKKRQAAKVGLGVGKQKKAADRPKKRKGVGISSANIHWATLGTTERQLKKGSKTGPKAGHPTGKMPAILEGVVPAAFAASSGTAMSAATSKIRQVIQKEAQKKG